MVWCLLLSIQTEQLPLLMTSWILLQVVYWFVLLLNNHNGQFRNINNSSEVLCIILCPGINLGSTFVSMTHRSYESCIVFCHVCPSDTHVKGTLLVPCSLKNQNIPIIWLMLFSNTIDLTRFAIQANGPDGKWTRKPLAYQESNIFNLCVARPPEICVNHVFKHIHAVSSYTIHTQFQATWYDIELRLVKSLCQKCTATLGCHSTFA